MKTPVLPRIFFPHIPADAGRIYGLSGSSMALFLSVQREPFVVAEQTEDAALRLYEDIRFFRELLFSGADMPSVCFFPEPNGSGSSGARAQLISGIENSGAIIASVASIEAPVWLPETLNKNRLSLAAGEELERELAEKRLKELGYRKVSIVVEKGEYSLKGWLLDIFPSTCGNPVRVEFFGDEIENIRSFDIESQRSVSRIKDILILPASEPPPDCVRPSGLLAYTNRFRIFDAEGCLTSRANNQQSVLREYMQDAVILSRFDFAGNGCDAGLRQISGLGICHDERKSLDDIAAAIKPLSRDNAVIVVSSSAGQAERVRDLLFDGGIIAPIIKREDFADSPGNIIITTGKLSAGSFPPGLLILSEKEMFGERPVYRSLRKSNAARLLLSVNDIAPGDFVVHNDHGIGRFTGMQKQSTEDFDTDLIVLEYHGGDRLYIPLYNINRIKKYNAGEGILPPLDRLGSKTWQKKREKAEKAIKEMTEKLLKLYAEREISEGFSFSPDTEFHREFDEFFPYEETPDQIKAIKEITADMESDKPMDRLLCGDVGYGKTEVAIRAAFKAVYDGKQVAVLVPTTILCEQHYQTFCGRFSAFPVKIDYLSRFKSRNEQVLALKSVAKGETSIIIGTHGLLGKGVEFNNLGLLVIDEEHKFGVGQKEKIKELKKGVDVLSMTATPIPRTLQMALSGGRPMSVIETPPEERLAVRSMVAVFSGEIIKEAVERETERNGQVLFVHNTVFDIEKTADFLRRLLPGARVAVAHGQMAEKRLEEVMHGFINRDTNVLVSTNIIGSGLDIPTANTLIVNNADKLGLADLYQLKGRVGRSNVKAYAYFLIPGENLIKDEAKRRLQAVKELSFLGAGFRLAVKDLEMRGAGNLLGAEQSGHIHAIGFDLYLEMLEKTVAELKGAEIREEIDPTINLRVSALIPESYIEDLTLRLSMYRRIANAKGLEDIADAEAEMADRFGSLPEETRKLLDIMRLKLAAKKIYLTSLSESGGRLRFAFSSATPVTAGKLLGLQKRFEGMRLHKDGFDLDLKRIPGNGDLFSVAKSLFNELL